MSDTIRLARLGQITIAAGPRFQRPDGVVENLVQLIVVGEGNILGQDELRWLIRQLEDRLQDGIPSGETKSVDHADAAPLEQLLGLNEVAARMAVTRRTVERLIFAKKIQTVSIGRRRLVSAAELCRLVDSLSQPTSRIP